MVFVAKIGATVAAATGVPVLKMVFWAMVWSCCFCAPMAGWDGSVIRVAASRGCAGRWMLIAAEGGCCWIDRVGRLRVDSVACAAVVVITGD